MHDEDAASTREPLTPALRVALAFGMLGIAFGAALALTRITGFEGLFSIPGYGHHMIPAFLCGGIGMAVSIYEVIRTGHARRPLLAFLLGLTALATPFFVGLAIVFAVLAVVVMALVG